MKIIIEKTDDIWRIVIYNEDVISDIFEVSEKSHVILILDDYLKDMV